MRPRFRAAVAVLLALAPLALLAACSSAPPEQQILSQFFRAARTRDNETTARMAAVEFDPREQGEVTSFDITNVSEERRTKLDYKALMSAQEKANAELETAVTQRREFENANRAALEAIAKLEKDPAAKFNPTQQKLKADWDVHRQRATELRKAVASAKTAYANGVGPADASLAQPGQAPFAPDKFEGELVSKDVTLNAQVRKGGETTQKTLVVTIQRVEGTLGGTQRVGRPIITRIQGA
jgi:hypothetical protein